MRTYSSTVVKKQSMWTNTLNLSKSLPFSAELNAIKQTKNPTVVQDAIQDAGGILTLLERIQHFDAV